MPSSRGSSRSSSLTSPALVGGFFTTSAWEALQSACTQRKITENKLPGINWEIGTDIYTILYVKQVMYKNLLYRTRNYTQYSVMTQMGKESKEWLYVYA